MSVQKTFQYAVKSAFYGVAVGDAVGVPFEFIPKEVIAQNKATTMIGGGSHGMPIGTFSDDTSLTFCLAEALINGFNLHEIGQNFIRWYMFNYWTATGHVFDVGETVRRSICRLDSGTTPELSGGADEMDNGNGALMRILPLLFYIKDKSISERFSLTKKVASITHRHIRSTIACFYYLEFAMQILKGNDKFVIYKELQTLIPQILHENNISEEEIALYYRLFEDKIYERDESEITANCYVLETLEASVWSLLTTDSYRNAVLRALNLGEDTDTTSAVTGGLAGLLYGFENIPQNWVLQMQKREEIDNLIIRFSKALE